MTSKIGSAKFISIVKTFTFVALSALTVNAFAGAVYVGNPTRPGTIWMPPHCKGHCIIDSYYIKYINPPVTCRDVHWACDRWQPTAYTLVGKVTGTEL